MRRQQGKTISQINLPALRFLLRTRRFLLNRTLLTAHCSLLTAHCSLLIVLFLLPLPLFSDSQFEDGSVPLDEGAFVYILADVNQIRPILDTLPIKELKNWQAVLVIDGTDTAVAALFERETGRRFQLVGWGSYPSFTARIALFLHINWKLKHTERGSYWYSNRDRLSVRIASRQIYTMAWRFEHLNPVPEPEGVEIPEGFIEFRNISGDTAPLSLWMENANVMLNQMFSSEKLSLRFPSGLLYINLYPVVNGLYRAELRIHFNNESQARRFVGNMSRLYVYPFSEQGIFMEKLFYSSEPVINGRSIDFQSGYLSNGDIVSLMMAFISLWR
jgi:hypothetical protein